MNILDVALVRAPKSSSQSAVYLPFQTILVLVFGPYHQRRKSVYNFGGTELGKISDFFRDGDRSPININGAGTQTTQISIIHQLHIGHIRGRIE